MDSHPCPEALNAFRAAQSANSLPSLTLSSNPFRSMLSGRIETLDRLIKDSEIILKQFQVANSVFDQERASIQTYKDKAEGMKHSCTWALDLAPDVIQLLLKQNIPEAPKPCDVKLLLLKMETILKSGDSTGAKEGGVSQKCAGSMDPPAYSNSTDPIEALKSNMEAMAARHRAETKKLQAELSLVTKERDESRKNLDAEREKAEQMLKDERKQVEEKLEHERKQAEEKLEHERKQAGEKLEHERKQAEEKLEHERKQGEEKLDEEKTKSRQMAEKLKGGDGAKVIDPTQLANTKPALLSLSLPPASSLTSPTKSSTSKNPPWQNATFSLLAEKNQLKTQLSDVTKEREDLKKQITVQNARIEKLMAQIKLTGQDPGMCEKVKQLQAEITELKAQLRLVTKERDESREKLEAEKEKTEKLKDERKQAEEKQLESGKKKALENFDEKKTAKLDGEQKTNLENRLTTDKRLTAGGDGQVVDPASLVNTKNTPALSLLFALASSTLPTTSSAQPVQRPTSQNSASLPAEKNKVKAQLSAVMQERNDLLARVKREEVGNNNELIRNLREENKRLKERSGEGQRQGQVKDVDSDEQKRLQVQGKALKKNRHIVISDEEEEIEDESASNKESLGSKKRKMRKDNPNILEEIIVLEGTPKA